MDHQNDALCLVEAYRLSNLIEDKLAFGIAIRGREGFPPARDLNRIGVEHAQPLEELPESRVETVVKAPDNSRIAVITLTRRIEMEQFFQLPPTPTPL